MPPTNKKLSIFLIILPALGFLDSLYLSVEHIRRAVPVCIRSFKCDLVTTSKYSVLLGVPLPYLGLIYYATLFILAVLFFEKFSLKILNVIRLISGVGLIASLWFLYIQGGILHAWCIYCILSAIFTALIHILSHLQYKKMTGRFI